MSFDNSKTGQCTSLCTERKLVDKIVWVDKTSSFMVGCVQTSPISQQVNKGNKKGQVCRQAKLMVSCGYNYPIAGN